MKIFTTEELCGYDGRQGRPAYVAYKGLVYDVSESPFWKEGMHVSKHFAGQDLTGEMDQAPHRDEVFKHLVPVGEFIGSIVTDENEQIHKLRELYRKFHPHPMVVHLTMGLVPFALVMHLIYLFSKNFFFYYAGYFAVAGALLGVLLAAPGGLFSWWLNYEKVINGLFIAKMTCATLLALMLIIEICLGIKFSPTPAGILRLQEERLTAYTILLFLNLFPIFILGHIGGKFIWKS